MNTHNPANEFGIGMAMASLTSEGRAQSPFAHLHGMGHQLKALASRQSGDTAFAEQVIRIAAETRGENVLPFIPGPKQPARSSFTADEIIAAGKKRRGED